MDLSLHLVIPVYNEAENILGTLEEVQSKIKSPYHIWMIYDFEEDTTLPVVKKLDAYNKTISLVKNTYGGGVLGAIKTGFDYSKDGAIAVIMADLSDEMSVVNDMFEKVQQGYDLVCGSRYMPGGKQIGGRAFKKFLSRMAGLSLHFLTGIPIHDATNNFRMYHKRILDEIEIESSGGFEVAMEITVKAYHHGFRLGEIPTTWRDRTAGESRFKLWKWMPKYLRWYLYALTHRPMKRASHVQEEK